MMTVMTIMVRATSSASTNTTDVGIAADNDARWSSTKATTFVDKVILLLLGR